MTDISAQSASSLDVSFAFLKASAHGTVAIAAVVFLVVVYLFVQLNARMWTTRPRFGSVPRAGGRKHLV